MKDQFKHPLEEVVLDLMRKHGAMDASKLAPLLSGSNCHGVKEYKVVASDVLGVLLQQGRTYKDCVGCHHIKPVVKVGQVWKDHLGIELMICKVESHGVLGIKARDGKLFGNEVATITFEPLSNYYTLIQDVVEVAK